jgi:hypothetical protein
MQEKSKTGAAIVSGKDLLKEVKVDISEKIKKFAYSLFEKRGYVHGNDKRDWLEAEKMMQTNKAGGIEPHK